MSKNITLLDFLTVEQIEAALAIWERSDLPAQEICDKIIRPNMAKINKRLGQENDPRYLAYAVEYTFNSTRKRPGR